MGEQGMAWGWPVAIAFVVAYLIGSIPFGFLITRLAGAGDIRTIGSGNIGATNVLRTGRKSLALLTLLADLLKGAVPVWVAFGLLGPEAGLAAGAATVLGHCFPVWLSFKGGKGVATAAGVILALTPLVLVPILAVFIIVVWLTRYVSLGSMLAAALAPIVALLLGHEGPALLFLGLALLIVAKHGPNLGRLIGGTESKVSFSSRR
ncbi:acyl-phosphate glycerol-3-phosphate acyltransferase [Arboricoccus pini]|uniref:Glycerol-3-phosphate acyltransferase n=1 Tax=Arboricoccus pini TaxID=1963835 RepID=A0A212Q7U1_9PROT|nr:glycerol-3-phosphate 1-O-acyltransferase PlsY [Arboricoccus pini]SNB55344.1 acyl-phosphate glycerol-3-phosphate acyltransferase [Arboricoccus pini]